MLSRVSIPLLAALVASASAYPPASFRCDLEKGWDIKGHDYKNVPAKTPEDCCGECSLKEANTCWSWTWTNYNGGTCWLKGGASEDDFVWNPNAVSARVITMYMNPGADACYLLENVDFYGNDIASKQAAKPEDCCAICQKYDKAPGCRAYSWNNYNGGTCWLKSKRSNDIRYTVGVKSASVYSDYDCRGAGVWPIEKDVDYVGNDLANVPGSDASKCGDLCHKQTNCTAFSWNNYVGGMCWLKSARDKTVAKTGVTSSVFIKTSPQPYCY